MKYGVDDKPPLPALLLYALQWWVVSLPCVVILGSVTAALRHSDPALQVGYVQQLFVVIGLVMAAQILLGHRLPLNPGPASTLLIGLAAAMDLGPDAQYTALGLGGAVMAVAGFGGALQRLRRFFTPRIVAVVLVLIAATLVPVIINLLFPDPTQPGLMATQFVFLLAATFVLFYVNGRLPGVTKSLTVLLGIVGGTAAYCLLLGAPAVPPTPDAGVLSLFAPVRFAFDAGATLAFLFCFLALAINEVGSIESLGHMLRTPDMDARVRRGVGLTGIANAVCGGLGLVGPVDYALSSGIIAATGCASRFAMLPAALGLVACGLVPSAAAVLLAIPTPVLGVLFLYLMSTQLASGLAMLAGDRGVHDFNSGVIVALPLMVGLVVTFSPPAMFQAFPSLLRPLLANGFVMGIITVLLLEHWLLGPKTTKGSPPCP